MRSSLNQRFNLHKLNKNITIVVRGVGERTEELCVALLSEQVDNKNIHLIHETPFSTAVKKSFEIGIQENRNWLLVADADVLVRSNAIAQFYQNAQTTSPATFVLHTQMIDKFFGGIRAGGLKLYRSSLLPKALGIVPEVANRPEGFVAKNMHKQGHYLDITETLCGLHDYEQYYEDIFRKGFAHGIKHGNLLSALLPYWQRMRKEDNDFEVLLAGYEVAKNYGEELKLDKDEAKIRFESYMRSSKLTEKEAIDKVAAPFVDDIVAHFIPPAEYSSIHAEIEKQGKPVIPKGK